MWLRYGCGILGEEYGEGGNIRKDISLYFLKEIEDITF